MATVELSEVLSRDKLRGITMVDTENLITLVVAMQKTQEKDWLETYESLGEVSPSVFCFVLAVTEAGGHLCVVGKLNSAQGE